MRVAANVPLFYGDLGYLGKKQKLQQGTYTWYVWPGLGSRNAARYGALLGSRTFVVVKKPPPL